MANQSSDTTQQYQVKSAFKVRLVSTLTGGDTVYFDTTPSLGESGGVEYSPVSLIHMPGEIQVYKGTKSRSFSIGAKLISRTSEEASVNIGKLQTLRSWRYPYFGINSSSVVGLNTKVNNQNTRSRTGQTSNTPNTTITLSPQEQNRKSILRASRTELLGAPPEVLFLYAYSGDSNDNRGNNDFYLNINRVPVVLTNLSISYPEDVDYIPTQGGQPFPTRMEVTLEVMETHSPREFEQFSLQLFRVGQLKNF